jgi:5-methylcytosine-specific restriction endonuclease McrA
LVQQPIAILAEHGVVPHFIVDLQLHEVHHQKFRSRSGEDSPDNLITLCVTCHTRRHRP